MNLAKKLLWVAPWLLALTGQTALAQLNPAYSSLGDLQVVQQSDPLPTSAGLFPTAQTDRNLVPNMLSSNLGPSTRVDRSIFTSRTITTSTTILVPRQVITPGTPIIDDGPRLRAALTTAPTVTTVLDPVAITSQQTITQRQQRSYYVPSTGRGFRISDNESPAPPVARPVQLQLLGPDLRRRQ